jgi:TetR/AcrR family transcriptional regulator, regulator of mycofactocin system
VQSPGTRGLETAMGRPKATSHDEIERVAFELFASQGFEATTLEAIAERIGVSRRTVTRYYASKNDIPWGRFDRTLAAFATLLAATPAGAPLWERVHRSVVEFNDFPRDAIPSHRERMRLILHTPTLVAHSTLRYAQWRGVVAQYVAAELGLPPAAALPRLVGHVTLGVALSAYEEWLAVEHADEADLSRILDAALTDLQDYFTAAAHPSR